MYKYRASRASQPGDSVAPEPSESAPNEQTSPESDRTDPHAPRMRAWERLAYKFSNNGSPATASSITSVEEEFHQYSTITTILPRLGSIESLKFWQVRIGLHVRWQYIILKFYFSQANDVVFPTLFAMAMDYLPIQSSSVPCERVFSSSAETDTKKRNRIHPALMEALQLLKYAYKMKGSLDFTRGILTNEADLAPSDRDLLADLVNERNSRALDSVLSAVGLYESD